MEGWKEGRREVREGWKRGRVEEGKDGEGGEGWKRGRMEGGRREEGKEGRMGLDSRGLMDFLIRDVGVDFLGEVVVFAVHL